jgi:hypothetical protein
MADLSATLEALATCVCAELGSPGFCFCGVIIGEDTYDLSGIGDCADDACGQAWVRVTDSYMASSLGEQDVEGGNCGLELNVEVEIGAIRCLETPERGEANTPEELLAAFRQANADMLAIRRAVFCCDAIDPKDVILGTWTPQGPLGGLYGGIWTAVLGGF